ncbi:protein eyes shut isoform X1 [Hylaeus anthracinus]|uniref:protein eyes shut isoform X1 n=1 Tax=Hylaeus anthracinus TaxID=313031 RepID=UPI0023B9465D|nr:protein eyes shut isoform X1 [Hylaeus anthracinus]XP_054001902.1 protein eyes shut isoform X1 [Hylaeus anthracinus]
MHYTRERTEKFINERILVLATVLALTTGFSRGLNCSGDPCMYGICLEDANSTYSCYCIDGYTGINCDINWDDCWSNPCLNGGTCNDAVAAYNCTCAEGFVGTNCEQRYSECSNQPCLNNGTCVDRDGIICQCPEGYSGDYCEIDASVCNDTICKNGGECVEGPGFSFFCRCPEGWTGRLCDEDIDECVASPCKNGGLCINMPASYTCACLFGYTGKDCDKAIVPCEENPCKNDAVCLFEDERSVCYCVPDYHGTLCELKYDDCESKFANCENGGSCVDGINSFTCACPAFYSGLFCNVYDLPSTVSSTFEEPFETDDDKKTTASTSFSPRPATLPESNASPTASSTPTTQSSMTSKSTGRSYTKWYPFTDTPFTIDKNGTTLFGSSGDSATETTPLVTDVSSIYSIEGKGTSQTETVSMEPREFPDTSNEMSPMTSTVKAETEYPTQKSARNESTTADTTYQEEGTGTFASISDTTPSEANSTTRYVPITRYYPMMTTSVEISTEAMATAGSEKTSSFSTVTWSSSFTEPWQNKSSEPNSPTAEVPKSTVPSFTDRWSSTPPLKSSSGDVESSTFAFANVTLSSLTSSTSVRPIFDEVTSVSEPEQSSTKDELSTTESIGTECHGILCTAAPARSDSDCNCSLRGDCKTGSGITRAAFNGKSYVRQHADVEISENNNATLRIFVRIRARFKDGIILHVYFDNEKYALVYLEYGALKFQFSCGLETMLLGEIDSPVDNGYEVDIDTRFQYFMRNDTNKCSAHLLVNGTTAVSGEQILPLHGSLPRHANLHLGGIPLIFTHYFSHVSVGFTGCMDSLKINDVQRHFIRDSTETFQIEDCVSFLCLSNPCKNFGACEETNGAVRCRCIAGYTGPFCERSMCDENPCASGSTCISSPGTGFICVCPLGTHGLLCEEDTVINRPSFSVLVPGLSSYVAYGVSNSIKDNMELKMKLIPRSLEQISLIAYLGQSGSQRDLSDHLSITYVRGYIMLTWDLGAGVRRIFTSVPLSATTMTQNKRYVAHTVQVGRRGRDAWLAVDGRANVTGRVVGSMTRLDVSPILYIGGHKSKNFESLPHDLPLHTGFSGCIFDIELRTESAIYPITSSSPATGRGVGECHRNECIRHLCKNGAICLNHGATYSCICTKEWMGSDCSIPVEALSSVNSSSCHVSN